MVYLYYIKGEVWKVIENQSKQIFAMKLINVDYIDINDYNKEINVFNNIFRL